MYRNGHTTWFDTVRMRNLALIAVYVDHDGLSRVGIKKVVPEPYDLVTKMVFKIMSWMWFRIIGGPGYFIGVVLQIRLCDI